MISHTGGNLNLKTDTVALFLDLRRAFDTVNHNILFQKLGMNGIRGRILDTIKSYLSNRLQCVRTQAAIESWRRLGPMFEPTLVEYLGLASTKL